MVTGYHMTVGIYLQLYSLYTYISICNVNVYYLLYYSLRYNSITDVGVESVADLLTHNQGLTVV